MECSVHDLNIFRRLLDGTLVKLELWDADCTYIATCVELGTNFLSTAKVRQGLIELTLKLDRAQSHPWYGKLNGDRKRAENAVNVFLGKVYERFPMVIMDERINDLNNLGYHLRGEWEVNFDAGKQSLHLNASVSMISGKDILPFQSSVQAFNSRHWFAT